MRAPFQVLVIPYRITDGKPLYCVLHRADHDEWQFIAGGGEDEETPLQAAIREASEEGNITSDDMTELKSLSYVPADCIAADRREHWDKNITEIPEHCFAVRWDAEIKLSREHTASAWLNYEKASKVLKWESNRTALCELNEILTAK